MLSFHLFITNELVSQFNDDSGSDSNQKNAHEHFPYKVQSQRGGMLFGYSFQHMHCWGHAAS